MFLLHFNLFLPKAHAGTDPKDSEAFLSLKSEIYYFRPSVVHSRHYATVYEILIM